MNKIIIILSSIILNQALLNAQTLYVESAATIHVQSAVDINASTSATPPLRINGDVTNLGTITNNGEIQYNGNLTNNGNYLSSGDDVFVQNGAQAINGNFSGTNAFFNFLVDKSGTILNANANLDMNNALILNNGILNPNANIVHLKNASGMAFISAGPAGAMNNFVNGIIRQDVAVGGSTYYVGDMTHGNQPVSITFNNIGGATYIDASYSSGSAGPSLVMGCNSAWDKQGGTWTLSPNGVNGTYDYSITVVPSGANLAAIQPSAYDGLLKNGVFITNPCAQVTNNNTVASLTSFSNFMKVSTTNTVLPVTLLNFSGKNQNGVNNLFWETASEINNLEFHLQRSLDGLVFETIGTVVSKAKNGNSNSNLKYDFIDKNLLSSIYYYRLEQMDIDGRLNLSDIIKLEEQIGENAISISPNPTKSISNLKLNSNIIADGKILIYDLKGAVVQSYQMNLNKGENVFHINLESLASGMYLLKVYQNNTLLGMSKLVKE